MASRVIGVCSKCGGVVAVELVYMATVPPIPTCRNCGAKAKAPEGPVIEMEGGREMSKP